MNFKDIIGPDELDWKVIPLDWKKIGKNELKLGTPVSKDGLEANDASCYGILMDDVEKGKHFQARVIVSGCVDFDKAEEYSGVKISEEAKNAIGKVWSQAGGGLAELPDGVPYVETIYDEWGTVTVVAETAPATIRNVAFYDNDGNLRAIEEGKKYRVIFDGAEYICDSVFKNVLGVTISADGSDVVSETCPFHYMTATPAANIPDMCKLGVYEAGQHTFSVAEIVEEVHPVDMRCLPEGYPYKEQSETVVLEEQPVTLEDQTTQLYGAIQIDTALIPVGGETIEMTIDGVSYKCQAVANVRGSASWGSVWKEDINGFDYADFPFACDCDWRGEITITMPAGTNATPTIGIKIITETIHPMAEEFLPVGVGGGVTTFYLGWQSGKVFMCSQFSEEDHSGDFSTVISKSMFKEACMAGPVVLYSEGINYLPYATAYHDGNEFGVAFCIMDGNTGANAEIFLAYTAEYDIAPPA